MKISPVSGKRSSRAPARKRAPFTLLEILIVFVVIGLVMVIAAPAVIKQSDRLTIENALSDLRTAVNETALRSRATGMTLALTLVPDAHHFTVSSANAEALERSWQPPAPQNQEFEDRRHDIIAAKAQYPFPDAIQWQLDQAVLDDQGDVVFTFFPDGQAAAQELSFELCGKHFLLQVDRITSAPTILEIVD